MSLNFDSLINALDSLKRAYHARMLDSLNEFLLDACIQRFEYTYELSHKMLKRYLELTEPAGIVIHEMTFPELIRTGHERGLLQSSWDNWNAFRTARNMTSHTYDEQKALRVFTIISPFISEIDHLIIRLQAGNQHVS